MFGDWLRLTLENWRYLNQWWPRSLMPCGNTTCTIDKLKKSEMICCDLNLFHGDFISDKNIYVYTFNFSSTLRRAQSFENLFTKQDKNLFILHSKCHGCWWLGDARSQGISSHGIDLVHQVKSSLSARRVDDWHLFIQSMMKRIQNLIMT